MKRLIVIAALVTACATPPDIPEEAQDADGVGGATAIGTAVKSVGWLARLLMRLAGNTTFHIDVQATTPQPKGSP